ncbi:MAG: hypothetical protein Q3962_03875 [Corynebacterium sp.]|nr:hypothetical protein [Corynebacterium sp.]
MDLSAIQTQITQAYNFFYGTSLLTTYFPKFVSALANILGKLGSYFSS